MTNYLAADFDLITDQLSYPEGPVYLADGSVLLVDIKNQTLDKVATTGTITTVAKIPGGPNGLAIGPDGNAYICNCGGFQWLPVPIAATKQTLFIGGDQPADYQGGSLDKVNLSTGTVEKLYTHCSKTRQLNLATFQWEITQLAEPVQLKGPDDLVFDQTGGIWFSDWGKTNGDKRDITGLYYAKADGSDITRMVYPLNAPNGIALSPKGDRLYTVETYTGNVLYWELAGAGEIKANPKTLDGTYCLYGFAGQAIFDSMAVDELGNLYIATMLPEGNDPATNGGISVISPQGELLQYIEIKRPDGKFSPLPSNICFGGEDKKTAFITLGASGALIKTQATIAGLTLAFNA
ncbi:MAG: SMP-30/gluconolactonase/LRE family protein [Thalassotalea sp.]